MPTDRSLSRAQLIQELTDARTRLSAKEQQCRELSEELTLLKSKKLPEREQLVRAACHKLTERKRTEAALRQQETLLNSVMQTTDVMLVLLDLQFNFVWVNPAYAETCRMKPEAMVGKNHFALYPHAENEAIFQKVRDTGEGVFYKDKPFVFPDQPERGVTYWDWSLSPVKDAIGNVTGLVFSLRETTTFRQAEDALRRLSQFPEENPNPVLRVAADGSLLYANAPARNWLVTLGWPVGGQLPAAVREVVADARGKTYAIKSEISNPGDSTFWTSAVQPPGEDYINIYAIDVTERKKAEEALRTSEDRYRRLVETASEGIWLIDTEFRTIDVNDRMAQMLGYPKDEIIGRHVREFMVPDEMADVEQRIENRRRGLTEIYERRLLRKDGSILATIVSVSPLLDKNGIVIGSFGMFTDISALKQAEQELRHWNETLEQRVAERTELAESRARQLQALAAELTEAEERERKRVAELLHDDLQQILAAARLQLQAACEGLPPEPMLANVERLLEESIGKSRRLSHELSPAVLHHSSLVAAIEWLSGQMKKQFGLEVQLESDGAQQFENVPMKVFLFRAVQELLFNVVKHAGVKSACVILSGSGNALAITVSDQGRGFNPDILDACTETTGFGLLSLRERARYIGGDLMIESAPGRGSRFTLTVPIR